MQCPPMSPSVLAFRYLYDRGSFGCPAHTRHTSRKSLYWPITCQHNFILLTCGLTLCKCNWSAGLSITFFIAYFSHFPTIHGRDLIRFIEFKKETWGSAKVILEEVLKTWAVFSPIVCTDLVAWHGLASWKCCLFNYRLRFTTCKNRTV